jgi:hypothetical protein
MTDIKTVKQIYSNAKLFPILVITLSVLLQAIPSNAGKKMTESKPSLPKTIGDWTRPDMPQLVNDENIFDYMDGAGELYIGYRFRLLEAYEYRAKSQKNILVELYTMETPDDAFGLLSLDWGGEPVDLGQPPQKKAVPAKSRFPQALYGEGLLRLWADKIYARLLIPQETPESRRAILALGRSIIEGSSQQQIPELVRLLPESFLPNWTLLEDRVRYFRSHLVLNSLYFLSQENILELDHTTEAVTGIYECKDPSEVQTRCRFLKVRYTDQERAKGALLHFLKAYLPEHPHLTPSESEQEIINAIIIEDGWMGYRLRDNSIVLVFECPDQQTARTIMDKME